MLYKISKWWEAKFRKFKLWLFNDSLKWKTFSVFVRESNKSKTDLEFELERALIKLGAKVFPSNQKSCLNFMADGEVSPVSEADYQLLGTLRIEETSLDPGDLYDYYFSYRVICLKNGNIVDANTFKFSDNQWGYRPRFVFKKFAEDCCISISQEV